LFLNNNNTNILDILCNIQYTEIKGDEMTKKELLESTTLELRRGVIVLAVLSQLNEQQYGYLLIKHLADCGLQVDQGTLYPLLRRLETQGLLSSDWRLEEEHPRRYYVLSQEGRAMLPRLKDEWNNLAAMMDRMLK